MTDSAKHIAIVIPSLTRAGAERVAETLAREFVGTTAVTIVTMEPRIAKNQLRNLKQLPWADTIPRGCRHVHLPSTGSGIVRFLPLLVRFARLARTQRFDVVYSFLTWTNVLVAIARTLRGGYQHVASEHAMAESLRSGGRQLALLAKALPIVYRLPDWIVIVSDAARDSLLSAGVLPRPERAITIPNPVDADEVRKLAEVSVSFGATDQNIMVVCVARLHQQKDHATLLRAMTHLPRSYQLVLVGDGPLRQDIEMAISRMGLTDQVTLTGMVSNPYPYMRRADVVVLPSREEGFGLVAAEAAALSVPFVGANVGGLGELCGILGQQTFPCGDDKALADAILHLAHQPAVDPASVRFVDRMLNPRLIAQRYLRLAGEADRTSYG